MSFANLPAVAQFPVTKPSLLTRFEHLNTTPGPKGKRVPRPLAQQVKPFNFMLVAFPDTGDITTGGEAYWDESEDAADSPSAALRLPIRPIAPFESDPTK